MSTHRTAAVRLFRAPHFTLGFLFMSVLAVVVLIPFVYLLVSSFKDLGQFFSTTDMRSLWLPWPLHPENYERAITQFFFLKYLRNTLILATIQTTTNVLTSLLVAYGFARFRFPGRDILFVILLGTLMLPNEITFIPLYTLFRTIRWTNTLLPLVVPGLFGSAWSIFLIRQLMMNVPREMDEAAFIDGGGTWKTFTRVVAPQVKPALVVAGLFAFLWSWKDFTGPLIYIGANSDLWTLSLGLMLFESPTEKLYTTQLAAVALSLIPTVVIYVIGQRYFEKGINVTDLK